MKTVIHCIVFLSIILLSSANAQIDTSIFRYYPLQVSNSWVYVTTGYQYYSRSKITVTGTIILNNLTYFTLYQVPIFGNPSIINQRIDSLTGCILQSSTNNGCSWLSNEFLVDSLESHLSDSVKCNDYKCTDTSDYIVFGILRKTKKFSWFSGFELGENHRYAKNIGISERQNIYGIGATSTQLAGCCINGVVYGDTTLTGLAINSTIIPADFSLSQNYPNPFNPVTKIKFDIPPDSRLSGNDIVTLKIYDVLGREVETLINEQLYPGTYEAEWDGTNYPSGVYFYKLIISEYKETKTMVLAK
jgi:hypothetical protein